MITETNGGDRPSAFVIMPFETEFDGIYGDLIRPALEEAGYSVVRANSDLQQENILRKIVKGLTGATLVIADISTLNANVLYELGLSHGLRVPTLLLTQSIENIPFDLRSYTVHKYSTQYLDAAKLKARIKEIGEQHLNGRVVFGSPVIDFAPKRVPEDIGSYGGSVTLPSHVTDLPRDEDKGLLEANQSAQKLARVLGALAGEINDTVNRISPLLTRFDDASQDPAPGKTVEALEAAERIAAELNDSSVRIESYLGEIETHIRVPFQVLLRYLMSLDPEIITDRELLERHGDMFGQVSEKMPLVLKGIKSYRKSVEQLGLRSGALDAAARRNIRAIEKLVDAMEQIQAFISRAIQILEERTSKV